MVNVMRWTAALVFLWSAASAAIAEDTLYLIEFRNFQEALDRGDGDAAAVHGEAAWRAAEDALGDDRLTAILAYNYGAHVVLRDPTKALEPLRRAEALAEAGLAELPRAELALNIAFAEFALEPERNRTARRLERALDAMDEEIAAGRSEISPDFARMRLDLAMKSLARKHYNDDARNATRALQMIGVVAPSDQVSQAQALLMRGVATLIPTPRDVGDIEKTFGDFATARELFPPQESVEHFDPLFAQIIAWEAAAHAALRSLPPTEQRRFEFDGEQTAPAALFKSAADRPADCGIEWAEREAPEFPQALANRGYIGAAIIVYDIDDAGEAVNVRLLAEVPNETFGSLAVESAQNWRTVAPPVDHPGCRANLTTTFPFIIAN